MTFIVVLAAALSVGVLAWLALEASRAALARYRRHFTETARVQLSEFFLFIDPAQLWIANVIACVLAGALVAVLAGSGVLAVGVMALCIVLPRWGLRHLRLRRLANFDSQLPDALLTLASGLRAGAGVSSALRHLVTEAPAPLAQEFALMLREQRLGVGLDTALASLAQRVPTEATALTVSALRIATETGGNLAEALERISALVRHRLHMQARIGSLTAQGRLQAWVIGALPPLLAVVLDRLEPEAMAALWGTLAGWMTLAVIVSLEVLGLWWVRRIVRIDV
ncbi:type II secretion system F family protein [Achromobacter sp. GG226]|uniref:type II secretion system F family protein n=1 Tax=Verticiella alkaliphila TaxID=2779529 RepID=UPI001C0C4EB2|nr:type II secretion system F family protein [Verticiella sp. GG226]MBU4610121.1 type II secretion system F family protein [Verticiella sp. GG226]